MMVHLLCPGSHIGEEPSSPPHQPSLAPETWDRAVTLSLPSDVPQLLFPSLPPRPWPYTTLERGYDLVTGEQAPEKILRSVKGVFSSDIPEGRASEDIPEDATSWSLLAPSCCAGWGTRVLFAFDRPERLVHILQKEKVLSLIPSARRSSAKARTVCTESPPGLKRRA